ncbi:hypothetical protein ACQY1H_23850 (plasmid) [Agrobacterium vitis]|uniref:hypothetical protein n=1 Tax=Agrobacterium vitis TaxID=373 RepID=UPI003D29C4E9
MDGDYKVGSLQASDVARTYAVVQHLVATTSFEAWQAATASELQRRHWVTVKDPAGVVRGLCYFYSVKMADTCQLEVPVFAAISLFDEANIARELLDVARIRARSAVCDRIHFWPAGQIEWAAICGGERPRPEATGILYDLRASGAAGP